MEFIIMAISSNTNSFGLNQFVFVSRSGEAWIGLTSKLYCRHNQGDVITLPEDCAAELSRLGFECPYKLPDAPQEVIDEAWYVGDDCTYPNCVGCECDDLSGTPGE